MLKKVMAMLASKYLAIKVRIRAVETHLMIQSLLLRDKKMIRHLFRHRKHFNISNKVKDEGEDYQPDSPGAPLINNSNAIATTPVKMVQVAGGMLEVEVDDDDDGDYADSRRVPYEDEGEEDQSASVIEMMKNTKEEQGEKFVLEDDIDKVADLFIQRFHHQIRLQKRLSEGGD